MAGKLTKTEILIGKTLAGKPFFRDEQGPILAGILDRECANDEHRERVCKKALLMRFGDPDRPEDRCPGPAELAELCHEVSAVVLPEAKRSCEFCRGSGFEVVCDGAKRCRCGGIPVTSGFRVRNDQDEPERNPGGQSTSDGELASLIERVAERSRL